MATNPEFQAICDRLLSNPDNVACVLPGGKAILMAHPDGKNVVAMIVKDNENFKQMTDVEIDAYIARFFS